MAAAMLFSFSRNEHDTECHVQSIYEGHNMRIFSTTKEFTIRKNCKTIFFWHKKEVVLLFSIFNGQPGIMYTLSL